ncbi:MAG: hypothetical protein WDZ80_02960 [Candidatus Paceibacterota bacterium]
MKAFRFRTKISNSGTIQLPNIPDLFDQEVEIIILPKEKINKEPMKASAFVKKWAGFLQGIDIEKQKFDYLSEKYK